MLSTKRAIPGDMSDAVSSRLDAPPSIGSDEALGASLDSRCSTRSSGSSTLTSFVGALSSCGKYSSFSAFSQD